MNDTVGYFTGDGQLDSLLLKIKQTIQFIQNKYITYRPVIIKSTLTLYSNLLYDNDLGNTFRNQEIATGVICLTKKRFWLIMLSLLPTMYMTSDSLLYPMNALYISINAAGIFYIIFNLYPEVKQNLIAAKQAYLLILKIKSRRAWLYSELFDACFFTEANRYLSKEKYLEAIDILRKQNGHRKEQSTENSDSIYYAIRPPLNIAIKTRAINIIAYDVDTLQDACEYIAKNNMNDIKKLKSIPGISELHVYEAICYLEREMESVLAIEPNQLNEKHLVSYFLYAPDKLNYYAQKELPFYVGGRFNLKFKANKEEIKQARELSTITCE